MSTTPPKSQKEPEILVSLADFWQICKQARWKILKGALCVGAIALIFRLITPVEYLATSTFREKGRGHSGIGDSSFSALLLANAGQNMQSEAMAMMKSHTLLERLVRKLGLQASLTKNEARYPKLAAIRDNLKVEYALLSRKGGPILPDPQMPIAAQNIIYTGEVPTGLRIRFISEDTYQVIAPRQGVLGTGRLGTIFSTKDAGFSIIRKSTHPLMGEEYILTLQPMLNVINGLQAKLKIETDRDDRSLLSMKYVSPRRQQASEILNVLMFVYQEYLRDEQERVLGEQMDYLQTRHDEVRDKLQQMMDHHAAALSLDVASTGCIDVKQAMEFLTTTQQQYTRELFAIDLELKRLQQIEAEGSGYYERYATEESVGSVINGIVSQIRSLKQQGDSLELALHDNLLDGDKSGNKSSKAKEQVAAQFTELTDIHQLGDDATQMIVGLQLGLMPDPSLRLFNDSHYMIKDWCNAITDYRDKEQHEACIANFKIYLTNLVHLFHVHETAIQERLTHQQSLQQEFQGIDLVTAKELYINYSRDLNAAEAEARQLHFVGDQMDDPAFEISSLSTILRDGVSQSMIDQASKLLLALRDEDNRSVREQERLKSDLTIQKGFLSMHLNQMSQLLKLRQNLLQEKIKSLQSTTLGLTQQEISVLQKHLVDYIKTRINNLLQGRIIIEQHQRELQQEMAKLPSKWVSEKMIDHQTELNKKMVEEVTRLVETKNITSNLELIQSAPVDLALVPIQPKAPYLIVFALLGGLLGAFLMLCKAVVNAINRGVRLTVENLRIAHQRVAGTLSTLYGYDRQKPLLDHDLETLRRLLAFLIPAFPAYRPAGEAALMLSGSGPECASDLAQLMVKKGLKVLLMDLSFDQASKTGGETGLLQYLDKQVAHPTIKPGPIYDSISAGGISRFTTELIGSPRLGELIQELKRKYDAVLVLNHASLNSSEVEASCALFDKVILTITKETWRDIDNCLREAAHKNLCFVVCEGHT